MRWMIVAVYAGVALSATAALAQPSTGEQQTPRFDLQTYYPIHAYTAGVGGLVQLACTVQPEGGRLGACIVVSASPEGWGFEDATITLAETELQAGRDVRAGAPGEQVPVSVRWAPEGAPVLPEDVWAGAAGRMLELMFSRETELLGRKANVFVEGGYPPPLVVDPNDGKSTFFPGAKEPVEFR